MPTYPLSIPSVLKPKEVYLRKGHVIGRSVSSFTFEAQTYEHAGQKWLLDIDFAPVASADASAAIQFYQDIFGQLGTINYVIETYGKGTVIAWVTSTAYVRDVWRSNGGSDYRCLIKHTSGTFATDLAAGKWVLSSTATAFRLVGDSQPGWRTSEGVFYFDKLILEESQ